MSEIHIICYRTDIKNIRTENMSQQKGAGGHLLQLPSSSFHLPEGQVEKEQKDPIFFTVKYEEQKSYMEEVF
jgi:hypothetical protein